MFTNRFRNHREAHPNSDFAIEDKGVYIRTKGVIYRETPLTIDLCTEFLHQGAQHTLANWMALSERTGAKFGVGNLPQYFATLHSWYLHREDPKNKAIIGEAQHRINALFTDKRILTASEVRYTALEDIVAHDPHTPKERTFSTPISGKEGPLNPLVNDPGLNVLFEAENTQQINDVLSWISTRPVYIFRHTSTKKETLTVRIGNYSNYFFVGLGKSMHDDYSAIGMRIHH